MVESNASSNPSPAWRSIQRPPFVNGGMMMKDKEKRKRRSSHLPHSATLIGNSNHTFTQ